MGKETVSLAGYIDHTLLKPEATPADLFKICEEARQNQFASVCVNPFNVAFCAMILQGKAPSVCTVVGFPLGADAPGIKAKQTRRACGEGATEIDMVINIGMARSGNWHFIGKEIAEVVSAADKGNQRALVKVIIEVSKLTREQKIYACQMARSAGADFVKTCTGFGGGEATVEDIRLMEETVGTGMKIKASGGIKNLERALALIEAGAHRLGIGAPAGVNILKEHLDS